MMTRWIPPPDDSVPIEDLHGADPGWVPPDDPRLDEEDEDDDDDWR